MMKNITYHIFWVFMAMVIPINITVANMLLPPVEVIPEQITAYEYWFDNDISTKQSVTLGTPMVTPNNLTDLINAMPTLSPGIHAVCFRLKNTSDVWKGVFLRYINSDGSIYNIAPQKIEAYRYCIDDNLSEMITVEITPTDVFNLDNAINLNALTTGWHTLSIQFRDVNKKWGALYTKRIYREEEQEPIGAMQQIEAYQYFVDNRHDKAITVNVAPTDVLEVDKTINLDTLTQGWHTLSVRYRDINKRWSAVYTKQIYREEEIEPIGAMQQIDAYQYFVDNRHDKAITVNVAPTDVLEVDKTINLDTLTQGWHTLSVRYRDINKRWSAVYTKQIYREEEIEPIGAMQQIDAYQYFVDNRHDKAITVNVTPTDVLEVDKTINLDTLTQGWHTLSVRYRDINKRWSAVYTKRIYKEEEIEPVGAPKKIEAYQYFVDNRHDKAVTVNVAPTDVLEVDKTINLDTLTQGWHTLSVRFRDERKAWSAVYTKRIYKEADEEPVSPQKIVAYQYCTNDNYDGAVTVDVTPVHPLDLDAEVNANNNLSVGSHIIHIRFKDSRNAWNSVFSKNSLVGNPIELVTPNKCAGEEVTFKTDIAGTTADKIEWDFGDGSDDHPTTLTGTISEVSHTFPALYQDKTYVVTATITNSTLPATGKIEFEYTAKGLPQSQIVCDKATPCENETLTFTASGGDEYAFFLGTDTSVEPLQARSTSNTLVRVATFPAEQITVKVFKGNCSNTATITPNVLPAPKFKVMVTRAKCSEESSQIKVVVSGAVGNYKVLLFKSENVGVEGEEFKSADTENNEATFLVKETGIVTYSILVIDNNVGTPPCSSACPTEIN